MKNTVKIILGLALVMCMGLGSAHAQKFAYVDFQELMQLMPEYKKANTDLEAYSKTFIDESDKLKAEFEKKYADFQKNEATLKEPMRGLREKELQDIQSRYQELQQMAQDSYNKKQSELIKPVIDKAKAAIATVAKEGGYAYVFDTSPGSPILFKPEGDNILGAVKKKLGIL